MKIRSGFVSNSSSSSFLLFKTYLTDEQIDHIRNWQTYPLTEEYKKQLSEYAKEHYVYPHDEIAIDFSDPEQKKEIKVEPFDKNDYTYYPDGWSVDETTKVFDFFTVIDNFDMEQFLAVIGIDIDKCGLRLQESGGHSPVIGLNDATTDLKEYLNDKSYFEHYDDYWYSSKYYKDQVYPQVLELKQKNPQLSVIEPRQRKNWICEDAGQAINEAFDKVYKLFEEYNVFRYFLEVDENSLERVFHEDEARLEKYHIFRDVIKTLNEVKENWRTVDDFEIDESQLVIANLEGEGEFNNEGSGQNTENS